MSERVREQEGGRDGENVHERLHERNGIDGEVLKLFRCFSSPVFSEMSFFIETLVLGSLGTHLTLVHINGDVKVQRNECAIRLAHSLLWCEQKQTTSESVKIT